MLADSSRNAVAPQNPLLGKRISLISKKNIRYEGILYSINEQNATVALQNVLSYGTEGREKLVDGGVYVAPIETPIALLLFRGQDIKDLHVHETVPDEAPQAETQRQPVTSAAPAPASQQKTAQATNNVLLSLSKPSEYPQSASNDTSRTVEAASSSANLPSTTSTDPKVALPVVVDDTKQNADIDESNLQQQVEETENEVSQSLESSLNKGSVPFKSKKKGGRGRGGRGSAAVRAGDNSHENNDDSGSAQIPQRRTNKRGAAPGTGASLLNRKARGAVAIDGTGPSDCESADYDFQSTLEQFKKEDHKETDEAEAGDNEDVVVAASGVTGNAASAGVYDKNDFFDSISCDALDKEAGVDNRLRGAKERHLNTETFGAIALDSQRRRKGRGFPRGGGRGRASGGRGERDASTGRESASSRGGHVGRGRGGRGHGYNRSGRGGPRLAPRSAEAASS